jgi:hypothetical protein
LFVISLFIKLRIDSPTNVFDSIMSYKSEMLSSLWDKQKKSAH